MAKTYFSITCPTCGREAFAPFRSYSPKGEVVSGCVDHFHTGHLTTPSASDSWHNRPIAKRMRAIDRKARGGCVTETATA